MKGVAPLYRAFRKPLEARKKQLAQLQLLGRLEDYLTKEFAAVILEQSKGTVLPLINVGKKLDARRIDIALAEGDLSAALNKKSAQGHKPKIKGFIELKYIRNRHRWGYSDAQDETGMTFRSLQSQLGQMHLSEYAGYKVDLRSGKRDIYGLVFASYVRRSHVPDGNDTFVRNVVRTAKRHQFLTNNMKAPRLSTVYSEVPAKVLGADFRCSLYAGLWRLDEAFHQEKLVAKVAAGR